MSSSFRIDPSDARPIWRQIEENVRNLVASGALRPATSVPSVRDLARSLAVNPATVAKAYQRLTDAGVLQVRRGDGTYVATDPPPSSAEQRRERLLAEALRFASLAATLGAGPQESAAALAAAWTALAPPAEPAPADRPADGTAEGPAADGDEQAPARQSLQRGDR
ncbi:MAG: GntR family transcriptional regulator [Acidobacteria bacterium]|nr:GntR family transcriptional regulator [Acidobacteriota bacterium]